MTTQLLVLEAKGDHHRMSWFKKKYLPIKYEIALGIEKGDILSYEEEPSKYSMHRVFTYKEGIYGNSNGVKIITNMMTREQAITHLESLRLMFKKEIKPGVISDLNDQGHISNPQV